MQSKVLIPLDGSESAELAVEEALELSSAWKSVHLILVDSSPYQARQLEGYTIYADQYAEIRKQSGMAYLQPFKERLEAVGLEVSTSVVFGDPVQVIVKSAHKNNSELLIIGESGSSWFERHAGLSKYAPRLSRQLEAAVITVQGNKKKVKAAA
ncbi:MAG: universal stress protein [Nitrospinaceae bacterium]|jgi:nucleotide-binding universal stress UspA family protein|nr:universal stress protein [Nitrospinaceae bacterium]MBT3434676.1 universal stress protein [Nitrospinaceae bacterium]MBT3821362.1 universal stress protein [Nitrospinaceae bacterium]MBT4095926.1 universal stress protein [Nitrospinaceae bacterium]MBT4430086.1 universal stress protein [Nitrospinaceae bacterium]